MTRGTRELSAARGQRHRPRPRRAATAPPPPRPRHGPTPRTTTPTAPRRRWPASLRIAGPLRGSGQEAPFAPVSHTLAGVMSTAARGGAPAQERELRAQGRKTMRRLLDAAMVVFEKRGFHAARVDDIVKVAKTSHGTFYLYFANKEDLFRALARDVADHMTELSESLGPVGPDEAGYQELRDWLGRFSQLYLHYGPVVRAWT